MKQITCLFLFFSFLAITNTSFAQMETGEASYYADKYHGRLTALGGTYDMNAMTCAHRTHDKGTKLRVTRLDNGMTVDVIVNDRGPFKEGRIVDLSRAAASKIDLLRAGIAQVKIEVINNPNPAAKINQSPVADVNVAPPPAVAIPESYNQPTKRIEPKVVATPTEELVAKGSAPSDVPTSFEKVVPAETSLPTVTAKSPVATSSPAPELTTTTTTAPATTEIMGNVKKGFAVQVASYSTYDDASAHIDRLKKKWFKNMYVVVKTAEDGISRYVVLMGPFETRGSANSYKGNLKVKYDINGFVLDLN